MNQLITMLLQNHNLNLMKPVKNDSITTTMDVIHNINNINSANTSQSGDSGITIANNVVVTASINSTIVQCDSNSNINNEGHEGNADDNHDNVEESSTKNGSNNNINNNNSFYNDNLNVVDDDALKSTTLNVDSENNFYSVSPSTLTSFESIASGSQTTMG